MMKEAQDIAQKLGVTFRVTIDKRIAGAEAVGAHKTSMLQDVEAGRSLETEALIGSILEMAKLTNTPAPAIEVGLCAGEASQQGHAAGRRRREGGERRARPPEDHGPNLAQRGTVEVRFNRSMRRGTIVSYPSRLCATSASPNA